MVPRPTSRSGIPFSSGGVVDNAVPTPVGYHDLVAFGYPCVCLETSKRGPMQQVASTSAVAQLPLR